MKTWTKLGIALAAVTLITLGAFVTSRALAPSGISYDPADKGYCEAYGIEIDSTQVEAIYLHPETILADPEAFLSSDRASLLLTNLRTQRDDPLDVEYWVRQIERIADLPMDKRQRQIPYRLSREVLAGKETFCRIAVPHVLSYLPEGAEVSTTYYQAALDPIEVGFQDRGGIVTAVSHPVYGTAEKLLSQGKAAIYNNMTHELFHQGYSDAWLWQVETPLENSALQGLVRKLQNEGMAVNAAYRLAEHYPSSLRYAYPLVHFRPLYRYLIEQVNKILENAESKTADELYQDLGRLYRSQAIYFVGGYMAAELEDQLGREALVATIETGPMAFIWAYNSVAREGMQIRFVEPEFEAGSAYQDLRTAALESDIPRVRDILRDIRSGQTPLLDLEAEGHLVYTSGYILLRKEHLGLAEEVFHALIAFDPQIAAGYVGLGDVYAQKGEIFAAIEAYERAMELDARYQWVAVVIAQLSDGQG